MAKLTAQELIDAIKELTVLELNDLVKACEEEFGVSAAAGVVVAAGRPCRSSRGREDRVRRRADRGWCRARLRLSRLFVR